MYGMRKESPQASLCLRKWVNVFDAETSRRGGCSWTRCRYRTRKTGRSAECLESTEGQRFWGVTK